MCRPEVICAYPITPQTHIVEALSAMVKKGELNAEFLNVESEFAALSVAIGASAAGARAYTATASQGLLYMCEAVYNAAGLGLPIVMTVANRAIGAPINIWNDHSDAMSQRDAGWLQLYAETNQEALDLHIQAFRIAERLSVPVMVCMDGFLLTHASERADIPDPAQVDAFLPRYHPRQVLDPAEPVSIGAMVGPEAFTEVRYLAYERMQQALQVIPAVAAEFDAEFGRDVRRAGPAVPGSTTRRSSWSRSARCSAPSRTRSTNCAPTGMKAGVLGITTFRPFPAQAIGEALSRRQPAPGRARAGAGARHRRHRDRRPADGPGRAARPAASPPWWPAWAAARSPRSRCATLLTTAAAGGPRAVQLPRPRHRDRRPGTGPDARNAPVRAQRGEHPA